MDVMVLVEVVEDIFLLVVVSSMLNPEHSSLSQDSVLAVAGTELVGALIISLVDVVGSEQ